MHHNDARRLERLTCQLAESLMTAAFCVEEIRNAVRDAVDEHEADGRAATPRRVAPPACGARPLLDESTLSVHWNGQRPLRLGNTLGYRLLDRLARRPNQFVTHLDLAHDVWGCEDVTTATIRSVVRHLRRKLCDGGMSPLAQAIRGHNGRYILEL